MICNFLIDRRDNFSIEIRPCGNYFTLHATKYPPNPRGGSVHDTHLYGSGQICVAAGHEPKTVDRAKAIAMSWCEGYSKYIRGSSFPNGAKRVNVNG